MFDTISAFLFSWDVFCSGLSSALGGFYVQRSIFLSIFPDLHYCHLISRTIPLLKYAFFGFLDDCTVIV